MEPEAHSPEHTQSVLKELRDFIDEAGDATELDMWTAVHTEKSGEVWVQLDNAETGLSYKLQLTPTD